MKKWLVIPGLILLIVTTVWAYDLTHTGAEIDQGVQVGLDVGAATGVIKSDGADNITALGLVTSVGTPGVDTNVPTEKAVRDLVVAIGAGDVVGPGSATADAFVLFNSTTGKLIKDSGAVKVTTVGDPGADTNIPSEQAVREAITASGTITSGTLAAIPATCTIGAQYIATDADGGTGWLYACVATNTWKPSPEVVGGVTAPYQLWRDSDAAGAALADEDTAGIDMNMETVTEDAEDGKIEHWAMKDGTKQIYTSYDGNLNVAVFGRTGIDSRFQYNALLAIDGGFSGDINSGLLCGATLAAADLITINPAVANKLVLADANAAGLWPARGVMVGSCTSGNPGTFLTKGYLRNDAWTLTAVQPGHIWLSSTAGDLSATDPYSGLASGDALQIIGHTISGGTTDIAYFDFGRPYTNKE